MRTKFYTILLIALFFCFFSGIQGQSFNAQFIRMDTMPGKLWTDSIFHIHIYMRNTGTTEWSLTSSDSLVELAPLDTSINNGWGIPYIYMGQGNGCLPGDTFCFTSNLLTPPLAGKYAFRWQARLHNAQTLFGEIAAGDSITVISGNQTPPNSVIPDSVITFADCEYMGSFSLPNINNFPNQYTQSGLTLRNMTDGSKHLLLNAGTYQYTLYEVEIPQLVKVINGNMNDLNTATLVKNWGTLYLDTFHGEPIISNCGFWWDNVSSLLYWCHYNGYYAGNSDDTYGFPTLVSTQLNSNGLENTGSWFLPIKSITDWKGYWGGVTSVPNSFAQIYTGGRNIAVGFGGYYSICGTASRGPALAAIRTPVVSKDTVDLVQMMTYADPQAAIRNGDYLPNGVGYWNQLPQSPWKGSWTYGDYCQAGVFINLPDKNGVIMFSTILEGDITYYYGGYNFGTPTQQWYFYNPKDLGEAALGKKQTNLTPVSFEVIDTPSFISSAIVSGACFDSTNRLLYVYNTWAGYNNPLVNVYYIKKGLATPVILSGPVNQTVCKGQSATFSVSAMTSGKITYQWQKNGSNISFATETSYSITNTTMNDSSAKFRCIVSNSAGSDTSNYAILSVNTCTGLENEVDNEITIYPNPATNFVMINKPNTENIHIQLFDITGIKIMDEVSFSNQINISNIKPGIYLLFLNNKIFKLIKE